MEMPKQKIQIWIDALRSGKYKQGQCQLQNADLYCCLGVACNIFIPENVKISFTSTGSLYGQTPAHQVYAPKWLKSVNTDFEQITKVSLTDLNDHYCASFKDIADLLEKVYIKEETFDLTQTI